jgi:hypothetical protein
MQEGGEFLLLAFAAAPASREGRPKQAPEGGGEIDMSASAKRPAAADVHALLAAVAGSPIVSGPSQPPSGLFADWEKERKSADVDALILAWIASHVRGAVHRGRLH